MQTYLVGGAVRDKLLGVQVVDRDWVVVGSSPEQMKLAGFRPVGKDFPVFLHPDSAEEYALARTERKSGQGYHGFEVHAAADVTLEEDLLRRDLTINAIAEADDGELIDPFGGVRDIEKRVLRHVSEAFVEDPVRVLRVARFAARLAPFGFTVATETQKLMRDMVASGEVDALVAERVWAEIFNALDTSAPQLFFSTLRSAGALQSLLPEVNVLFDVPQRADHHPEGDVGTHTMLVIEQASRLAKLTFPFDKKNNTDEEGSEQKAKATRSATVYAALCHDLGKALTPAAEWPAHHGHEERGVKPAEQLSVRMHAPNHFRELAMLTCRYHTHSHRAFELKPTTLVKTLMALDALRRPERFRQFLLVCEADARGRATASVEHYPQSEYLQRVLAAMNSVDAGKIAAATENRNLISEAIYRARVSAVKLTLGQQSS